MWPAWAVVSLGAAKKPGATSLTGRGRALSTDGLGFLIRTGVTLGRGDLGGSSPS